MPGEAARPFLSVETSLAEALVLSTDPLRVDAAFLPWPIWGEGRECLDLFTACCCPLRLGLGID